MHRSEPGQVSIHRWQNPTIQLCMHPPLHLILLASPETTKDHRNKDKRASSLLHLFQHDTMWDITSTPSHLGTPALSDKHLSYFVWPIICDLRRRWYSTVSASSCFCACWAVVIVHGCSMTLNSEITKQSTLVNQNHLNTLDYINFTQPNIKQPFSSSGLLLQQAVSHTIHSIASLQLWWNKDSTHPSRRRALPTAQEQENIFEEPISSCIRKPENTQDDHNDPIWYVLQRDSDLRIHCVHCTRKAKHSQSPNNIAQSTNTRAIQQ